jgi:hypothetical protein
MAQNGSLWEKAMESRLNKLLLVFVGVVAVWAIGTGNLEPELAGDLLEIAADALDGLLEQPK